MTIAAEIEALIQRLEGVAICDDCITDRLNLSVRSQANVVTRGLGGVGGYARDKRPSGFCNTVKTSISHRR
ncbi:hypothetical protein [Sphingopyxis sp. MWB1]|uniref:hypothetical protein n=1 Tax=Sphingopyxis sp. MWB1 TaxID=1537715 RepID=UPI000519F215|nr:hypothetical protein [Sphingopyxis sp. MWB1]